MRKLNSMQRGFTLVQTILVLVMFAIVTRVAAPKFLDGFNLATTRTSADRFVRAHELARATAVRYGRDAELHIDTLTPRFWVVVDTTVNKTGVKDTIGPIQDLSASKVKMTSVRDTMLCYDARAMRSTHGGCQGGHADTIVFKLTSSNRVDSVVISTLGKAIR